MSFKLKIRKTNAAVILALSGDITGNSVGKISAKLESIQKMYQGTIAIDLSETTFIDSHGLGVFVFFYRRLSEEKRKLVFLNPSEFILDLFSGSNLVKIFSIVNSEEEL
ncbi:MAG: STAS domain-containing protein [Chitinispirillaceae bacterium]|nr:STAS domain-containing protein [Chitinispirillaceae bacterium]